MQPARQLDPGEVVHQLLVHCIEVSETTQDLGTNALALWDSALVEVVTRESESLRHRLADGMMPLGHSGDP